MRRPRVELGRACSRCRFVRCVDLGECRDFVRHGQVNSNEIELTQKTQGRSQFIRSNMESRVLDRDLALAQGRVLHLGREGMRDWIAKNPKADRRIDIARGPAPIFQIGERITLSCGPLFHRAS